MHSRLFLLFLGALTLFLAGCASDPSASAGASSIPWNRPESWEGGSGIPGLGRINEGR